MRKVVKSAFKANFCYRQFIFGQQFGGMNHSVFVNELNKGFPSKLLKIPAKGGHRHVNKFSHFF